MIMDYEALRLLALITRKAADGGMKCPECGWRMVKQAGTLEPDDWYWLCPNQDCAEGDAVEGGER